MSIVLDADFDGGNPQQTDRIVQRGENEFWVYPFSEDGDPNYKFRLDVVIRNSSSETNDLALFIDWQTGKYMEFRNYCYVMAPGNPDWRFQSADVLGTVSRIHLAIDPGETYLSLHPKYSYADYLDFVRSVKGTPYLTKYLLGSSSEGREIWSFIMRNPDKPAKENLLAVGRIHPYETAGSYCAEGIIDKFRELPPQGRDVLKKVNIIIVPMIAPDGVFHGFGKLTTRNGVDLSKKVDLGDKSCSLLKELIDEMKPSKYIEFHNWMFPDADGIYYLNAWQCLRFIARMPSQKRFGKKWKPVLRKKVLACTPTGFKKYCRERYGSICACFEYPWFGRNVLAMKNLGWQTIIAVNDL